MIKIAHLTSVHPRYDTRIFIKQCCSLSANKNYEVFLIVADGKGNEKKKDITILDVGKPKSRLNRIFCTTKKIYKKSLSLNASIYHIHDPELIPVALRLKNKHSKIIFDSHEIVPLQLLSKPYLNKFIAVILSKIYAWFEYYSSKKFDCILTVVPYQKSLFLKRNPNTFTIYNYPIIDEFLITKTWTERPNSVCYIGGLSQARGINELLQVAEQEHTKNLQINIAGKFSESDFEEKIKNHPIWEKNINYFGFVDRKEINNIMNNSKIGILTLHSTPNHQHSYPIKLFEYMAAGLPIIFSDFKTWKNIINQHQCGISVDPMNPKEISNAIIQLINSPEEAKKMGERARKAIETKYNWQKEAEKLLAIYQKIMRDNE